jgi:type IV pilus assembly protein PilY1
MNSPFSRSVAAALTLLLGLVCMAPSGAQTTLLADKPIAAGADVPGNLALALSVEFPTAISIANLGDYVDATQYIGYFDPLKCYTYRFSFVNPALSHFKPTAVAAGAPSGHDCSGTAGQWSGNFMNWATMQTIDPFRWALTGGYRSIDSTTQTILEKAWGSGQGSASSNFPYRGTSQGGGNNLSTSGSLIAKLTPFNSWSKFDLGIWGNGNAMVFSGDGNSASYQAGTASAGDLSNLTNANSNPNHAYRVYIRVEVCNTSLGVANLEPNCVKYGGNYKPEGLLQQYSQKIRFSAFGYLNEGGDVRQGGAMRAPMGFIGPKIPQPLSTTLLNNPKPEWDFSTGVMSTNPDTVSAAASSVTQSGVMNYLNKFGEFGQTYKTYDNVGELYYAAVRYFENLGNVPEWTNSASATGKDGFPALTVWPTDTAAVGVANPHAAILYSCQKNFILGIGDDHTWYDYDVGGNTGPGSYSPTGPSRPVPGLVTADTLNQAALWTQDLQTLEGISLNPKWALGLTDATYFIAGLAYGVHVNDIRPDLANTQTISTYWMDVAEGQHLENLNPYYLAAKYGGFSTPTINAANVSAPFYTATNPAYDMLNTPVTTGQFDPTNATVNMNGNTHLNPDNYFDAGSAARMVSGLKSAFTSIAGSISQQSTSFSFSLPNVSSGGTLSFGAKFDSSGWTGTVSASNLTFDAVTGAPVLTPAWDTTTTFQTQVTSGTPTRNIATYNGAAGVTFELTDLSTTLMTAQMAALNNLSTYSSATCTSSLCPYLSYLRGDQTNEVSSTASGSTHSFRNRRLFLGDIVDAALTPVSTPLQTFSDANNPGYTLFKANWTAPTATAARPTMVYAGANDGMLHAFVGATGVEQFAYVPSAVFQGPSGTPQVDGLAALGNPNYIHRNYVDATPAAFDVDFNKTQGASGAPDWHTVLIGGLGKVGKSFYALDITDPASMTSESVVASKVLWEYPNNANPDTTLGFSYGVPVVVKTVKYGWVAILTSGYDNTDGYGYLYIVNPKTGALIEKIKTPSPSTGLTQASAFVKDFSDETADSVYVGDLDGQMWRFDLTLTPSVYPQPTLLASVGQPITTAPLIEIHPVTRKRYVLFGTGRLLAVPDLPSTQMQSFYAIVDGTASGFTVVSTPITRADLTPITNAQIGGSTSALGVVSLPTPNALTAGSKGWYTDLGIDPASGIAWRVLLNPVAFNGIVSFATSLTTATDPCSPQGSSSVYAIDYATVNSVLLPTVAGNPVPSFDLYPVAAINLRFTGANGSPEIVVGFTQGAPERVAASLTSTLATRILNWREIPTVE